VTGTGLKQILGPLRFSQLSWIFKISKILKISFALGRGSKEEENMV